MTKTLLSSPRPRLQAEAQDQDFAPRDPETQDYIYGLKRSKR